MTPALSRSRSVTHRTRVTRGAQKQARSVHGFQSQFSQVSDRVFFPFMCHFVREHLAVTEVCCLCCGIPDSVRFLQLSNFEVCETHWYPGILAISAHFTNRRSMPDLPPEDKGGQESQEGQEGLESSQEQALSPEIQDARWVCFYFSNFSWFFPFPCPDTSHKCSVILDWTKFN